MTWILRFLAVAGLLGVAGFFRLSDLERRPMHADESTGAKIVAERLEQGSYHFNPKHYHGPLLSALAASVSQWMEEDSWQTMRAETLRRVVAVCGLLTVIILLGCGVGGPGFPAAMCGAAFVATSPLLIYYSRMFIHEPLYLLCGALALVGLVIVMKGTATLSWVGAGLFGLGVGLMATTRETVVIALFCWAVSGLLLFWCPLYGFVRSTLLQKQSEKARGDSGHEYALIRLRLLQLLLALLVAFLVVAIAYQSESRKWLGFLAFFQSFFVYETTLGHEKPFWWFFELMVIPKLSAARWWTEGGLFLLALIPFLWWKGPSQLREWGRFFSLSGLLIFLVHSIIAYKTPWLICLGWMQLAMAAGCGVVLLWQHLRMLWRFPVLALLVWLFTWQGLQGHRAAFRFASDTRNPYAYVPTSSDVARLPPFLTELQSLLVEPRPLTVVGDQYWPLPWYLREMGPVGYWPTWRVEMSKLPLIVILPVELEEAWLNLEHTHTLIPRGLRTDTMLWVAVENELWSRYLALE